MALAIAMLCLAAPAAAAAFECTRAAADPGDTAKDAHGPALAWAGRRVVYTLQADGTAGLDRQATFAVLRQAFATWQAVNVDPAARAACPELGGSDLSLVEAAAPSTARWVGYNYLAPANNENLVRFADDGWPHGVDAVDSVALTTTTYSVQTGEILDADIEFNTADNTFAIGAASAGAMDLLSTAVHEVGHFLGLAHCGDAACGHGEVMEPSAALGEISKRLLQCDDARGLLFKYPVGGRNGACSGAVDASCGHCAPPAPLDRRPSIAVLRGGGGCQAGPGGPAAGLGALAVFFCLARRRRRPRAGHLGAAIALAVVATGCGTAAAAPSTCDGADHAPVAGSPAIAGLRLVGQLDVDPWQLVLAVDFTDGDGDLGGGEARIFARTDAEPRDVVALAPLFSATGGVPTTAQAGTFALPLRLSAQTAAGPLPLGLLLVDAAGHASACRSLTLEVAFP